MWWAAAWRADTHLCQQDGDSEGGTSARIRIGRSRSPRDSPRAGVAPCPSTTSLSLNGYSSTTEAARPRCHSAEEKRFTARLQKNGARNTTPRHPMLIGHFGARPIAEACHPAELRGLEHREMSAAHPERNPGGSSSKSKNTSVSRGACVFWRPPP